MTTSHSTVGTYPRAAAFLDSYAAAHTAALGETGRTDLTPRLAEMQAHEQPFDYGIIDRFLPEDLFNAAREGWPEDERLSVPNFPQSLYPNGYKGSRRALTLSEWGHRSNKRPDASHWDAISSALCEPSFVRDLFSPYLATIETQLENLGDKEYGAGFRLAACRDHGAKESLGSHLDPARKLLTIVIYLDLLGDTDTSSPHLWGTALYDSEPAADSKRPAYGEGAAVGSIEFTGNRAFVMPNASNAWHGVASSQAGVTRRTLMCGYWAFDKSSSK